MVVQRFGIRLQDAGRHKLVTPGILVTDVKSLYHHLNTTGKIPKARQTMIDLLAARDLIEEGTMRLCWVPTKHMLADTLTKVMKPGEVYMKFRSKQLFSLVRNKGEQDEEQRRLGLRHGQRQRRKARDKAKLQSPNRRRRSAGDC